MNDFIHLHNHTSRNSLLDSLVDVKDLVNKASEMNMPAVSTNGHHSMSDFVRLFKYSRGSNIKPIFGCELYIVDDMKVKDKDETRYHLNVMAKNKKGLNNLFKIVTIGHKEGFYYRPRVDFDVIKEHSEGLIVSSACVQGKVAQLALADKKEKAFNWVKKYKQLFGSDFYLEIMANKLEDQLLANKRLTKLADYMDIPLIATNDIHYLEKDDYKYHDMLLAIQTGAKINDEDRFQFPANEFYFKDYQEMREGLFDEEGYKDKAEKALENTLEVTDKVEDIEIELGNTYFPNFETPKNYTEDEYLEKECFEQLEKLAEEKDINYEEYKERLEHELEIITDKKYSSYFLIVSDFLRWAKNNGIMCGVARGSAGGCLVSYLMDIIEINPIKHDLLFSRFLNKGRDSLVDIDIDTSQKGREKLIEYVKNKYGEKNVTQICTFGTMSAKSVIKDVGRSLGIDFDYLNDKVVKAFPKHFDDLEDALEQSEKLQQYEKNNPKLFEYAKKIEDKPRHLGTHAAAVVITPKPVLEFTPLARSGEDIISQVEMHDAEELGMLKMDFLGLKTLDIIRDTIDFIHKRDDLDKFDFVPTVDNIWNLPLDDKNIYKNIFQKGDTNGVFQVESQLFKKLLKEMQPTKFEHIIALNAIGRPGVLDAGIDQDYFDRMHGKEEVEYPTEELKPVLENTYGLAIFQEQIMQMAQVIAGFSLGEGDILRRAIGK